MSPETLEQLNADAWTTPAVALLEAQLEDEDEDEVDWDDDDEDWDDDDEDWDDDDEDWDDDDEDWEELEELDELEAGRRRIPSEGDLEEDW